MLGLAWLDPRERARSLICFFFCFFLVTVEQISGMSEVTIDGMMGALQRLKEVRPSFDSNVFGYEN